MNRAWTVALAGAAAALALSATVLSPTALDVPALWRKSAAYDYAWLVLPMFVYLLGWHYRDELLACCPQPDPAGVALAGIAAIVWSVATAANIDIARQLALILVFQGIALSALGRALYWRILPLMALLFFLLPSADLLLAPLRLLTLKAVEWLALIGGLSFHNDGFHVHVGRFTYEILDACAGLSHVMLLAFLGYCCALLSYRSIGKIVALTCFAASLGVLSNVIRVGAIVWLDALRGEQMTLAAHASIQWAALSLVLLILFAVVFRLRVDAPPQDLSRPSSRPPSRLGRWAPLLAGLVVVMITAPAARLLDSAPQWPATASSVRVPPATPGWELSFADANGWARWSLGNGFRSLPLDYRRQGRRVRVTVVEALSPATKLQVAQIEPHDPAAFRHTGSERISTCADANCASYVHAVWRCADPPLIRHLYYRYAIATYRTESDLRLRWASAYYRVLGTGDRARLIAFAADGETLPLAELVDVERAIDAALAGGNA